MGGDGGGGGLCLDLSNNYNNYSFTATRILRRLEISVVRDSSHTALCDRSVKVRVGVFGWGCLGGGRGGRQGGGGALIIDQYRLAYTIQMVVCRLPDAILHDS